MLNVFSVDLEEWFHINDSKWLPSQCWDAQVSRIEVNTNRLLSLLAQHEVKATFFVMGWVAEKFPGLVDKICKYGHSIGYHSYYHEFPRNQTKEQFEEDLVKGIEVIKLLTGLRPSIYRAPNLSLDDKSLFIIPILIRHGFVTSSSVRSGRYVHGKDVPTKPFKWVVNGDELLEFPVNRISLLGKQLTFTGSGYFRLNPYSLSKYLFGNSDYNVAYFHPNDVDYEHPKHPALGWKRNWMNSVGTASCEYKISKLLSDFLFTDFEEASRIYNNRANLEKSQIRL
jgi:polysaccharide deacetylase family protein (PEP-CTERM system associated)